MPVTAESFGTSTICWASKYWLEKKTCCHRAQFMVIVAATMSTLPSLTYGIRWADVTATNWTCSCQSPKMAVAISLMMSTSKPLISPVVASRNPNRYVFWLTPATSRPLATILAMVEPAGIAPGRGRVPVGRRLARASQAGGAAWAVPVGITAGSCTPSGRVRRRTVQDGLDASVEPQPASASTAATMTRIFLIGTPRFSAAGPPRRPQAARS
jgi:hypothetical protein